MKVPRITNSQDHITQAALQETGISVVQPPAVLIVVRGMILARTFPTAVTRVSVTLNQDMKALIPKSNLDADFLALLLKGISSDLLQVVEESGHGTRCLRTEAWANFSLPLPPLKEQLSINDYLETQLSGVNTAISRIQREIDLIREYRTRLIADVVTGKVDVRGLAAELPAELEGVAEFEEDPEESAELEEAADGEE